MPIASTTTSADSATRVQENPKTEFDALNVTAGPTGGSRSHFGARRECRRRHKHAIAMAALSVFLMQSLSFLALLASVPTRPARRPRGRGRDARKWAAGPPAAAWACGPQLLKRAGRPRSQEHLRVFDPRAGGTPAIPGTPAGLRTACGRDARDPRNTCGSSTRLRAGRPRSQEYLRVFDPLAGGAPAIPGTPAGLRTACGRDARAPRNTCGSSTRVRAGRPRSRELLRACGPLAGGAPAIPGTPAGLWTACGRGAGTHLEQMASSRLWRASAGSSANRCSTRRLPRRPAASIRCANAAHSCLFPARQRSRPRRLPGLAWEGAK